MPDILSRALPMRKLKLIEDLVSEFREQRPIRGGSLIITLYGDAIAPRGGTIWLGSLIKVLEPLGVSQRLVRTSVFRLVKDGWLTATQIGRRSFYSLTGPGRRRFENATRRIYAGPQQAWDKKWTLVIMPSKENSNRELIRRELGWLGFGMLTTGLLAHPRADAEALYGTLQELGVQDQVVVMKAISDALPATEPLKRAVHECWNLEELEKRYERFLSRFRPLLKAIRAARTIDPAQCLHVRTLLIHEYRRILLRDPQLPMELLPADWSGASAHTLCRNLYRIVHARADQHLSDLAETPDGPLPDPAPYFYQRLGGL